MAGRQKWSDLSKLRRGLIIAAVVTDVPLRVAALIDIKRRPASRIRGPKRAWALLVGLVSSFGGAPLSYFLFGRRR